MDRTFSYWEKDAAINPSQGRGSANALPSRSDILIVGAGLCGSWLAYFLMKKNPKLSITIVERDGISYGASTRNAGFLSCGNISEWYEDVQTFGWEETISTLKARILGIQLINTELKGKFTKVLCGSFDHDEVTAEKLELMDAFNHYLQDEGLEAFFQLKMMDFGGGKRKAFFNSFDAAINPIEILKALHTHLASQGVKFFWHTNVQSMHNGAAQVINSEGASDEISYQKGFICTNAFASALNPKTIVEPARGQIILTSEIKTELPKTLGFLKSGYDYYRFIGDRLLVGGGRLNFKKQEDTQEIKTTPELNDYLKELAAQLLGHRDFEVDYHWSGIMGMRRGQHASISNLLERVTLDDKTEEIAGFGGWGVTLTPVIGQARSILA